MYILYINVNYVFDLLGLGYNFGIIKKFWKLVVRNIRIILKLPLGTLILQKFNVFLNIKKKMQKYGYEVVIQFQLTVQLKLT